VKLIALLALLVGCSVAPANVEPARTDMETLGSIMRGLDILKREQDRATEYHRRTLQLHSQIAYIVDHSQASSVRDYQRLLISIKQELMGVVP